MKLFELWTKPARMDLRLAALLSHRFEEVIPAESIEFAKALSQCSRNG